MDDKNKNMNENQPADAISAPQQPPAQLGPDQNNAGVAPTIEPGQNVLGEQTAAAAPAAPQLAEPQPMAQQVVATVAPAPEFQQQSASAPGTQPPAASEIPMGQPIASPAPASPFTVFANAAAQNQPQNDAAKAKNKKLIIIILSIVGGLCVIGIALLLYFLVFAGPSKAEYQASYAAATKAAAVLPDGESDAATLVISIWTDDASALKTKMNAAKTSVDDFAADNQALALTKGVNGRSVKHDYHNYTAKAPQYVDYSTSFVASFNNFATALMTCKSSSTSSASDYVADLKRCSSSIQNADTPNSDVKNFAGEYIKYLDNMTDLYNQYLSGGITSSEGQAQTLSYGQTMQSKTDEFADQTKRKFESLSPASELRSVVSDLSAEVNK